MDRIFVKIVLTCSTKVKFTSFLPLLLYLQYHRQPRKSGKSGKSRYYGKRSVKT